MLAELRAQIARIIPTGTIAERAVKSGLWGFATTVANRGSQVLMLIVLARLLEPRHFGLVGIALITLSATRQLTQIGLNAALIQQTRDNVDDYLDTTWLLEIGRGVLVFGVLFAAAPHIAAFFGEPEATPLIQVIAISPVLYGLRNPGVVYFRKDLEFHKEFVYLGAGGVSQLVVGVGYALYSPTVWALVFAFLARDAVQFGLSYVLHGYRPWPSFDVGAARELISYGKWITGSGIVFFLYSEGDDAFVGWYLTATALGFYQYAYRLADMPSSEISEVIAHVTFPAYSKLQEDVAELRRAVLQTTRLIAFVAFPTAFGIALVAPSFVPAILGEDWLPMVLVLQILAIYGLTHAISRNFGSLWKAVGRPDLTAKMPLVGLFFIVLLIWPATARWGIEGTAAVIVGVSLFPMLPLNVYLTAKLIEARSMAFYLEYLYPFVASAVMFGSLWYAMTLVDLSPLVEFLVLVPAGAIVYVAVAAALDRWFDWGIERNLRMIAKSLAASSR